jgi:hypothetical protein
VGGCRNIAPHRFNISFNYGLTPEKGDPILAVFLSRIPRLEKVIEEGRNPYSAPKARHKTPGITLDVPALWASLLIVP